MVKTNPYQSPAAIEAKTAPLNLNPGESKNVIHWLQICAASLVVLATLGACFFSKSVMAASVKSLEASGVGSVPTGILSCLTAISSGLMFSAPIWPALFLVFAPVRSLWRILHTLVWVAVIAVLIGVGNSAQISIRPIFIHQPEFGLVSLLFFLGWCVAPFCAARFFGWHLSPGPEQCNPKSSSYTASFAITWIVVLVGLVVASRFFAVSIDLANSAVWYGMAAIMGFGLMLSILILLRSRLWFFVGTGNPPDHCNDPTFVLARFCRQFGP